MVLYDKTKWLRFYVIEHKPKTMVLTVENTSKHHLGDIYWYGPWRQYIFACQLDILFNNQCLTDITEVLTKLNTDHKNQKKKEASPT